jgi:hypothetical protein
VANSQGRTTGLAKRILDGLGNVEDLPLVAGGNGQSQHLSSDLLCVFPRDVRVAIAEGV